MLAKLVESPFYATGGGQVHDGGVIECEDGGCSARVVDVVRLGDDQALVLEPLTGELHDGERVWARVDRSARRATECNHTATHLLHAALRERLGTHVHQAGSYVGPDKLRFDFTHGAPLSAEDREWVEDRVNAHDPREPAGAGADDDAGRGEVARRDGAVRREVRRRRAHGRGRRRRLLARAVRRHARALDRRDRRLQAHAGDVLAANVRRIEAITGPLGVELLRRHDRELTAAAVALRTQPDAVAEAAATAVAKRREAEKALEKGAGAVDTSVGEVVEIDGVKAVFEIREVPNPKALPDLADKLRGQLGDPAVVVLGAPGEGRASLLVSATPGAVGAGVKAGAVVKIAAAVVGGGGGGRDNMAQAGGKDPAKLPDALVAARAEIERALAGSGA